MVGSAVHRRLLGESTKLITRQRHDLDLCDQAAVNDFFAAEKPEMVIFCAAKVGGIYANSTYPADFAYDNLMMATNAICAAYQNHVRRFLFLGSTCIYPRDCPQPIREESLLTGPLEKTNEAYAVAKIAGLKLCEYHRKQHGVLFHSAMPTNLYGPGDNYHLEHSHVLPALLRRFHEAKEQALPAVTIWGTGMPRREFLHVDDLVEAIVHLSRLDNPPDWVNVGTGKDISIQELARLVAEVVGYQGEIKNDLSKPDGTPLKRTNTMLLNSTGWSAKIELREGLRRTYDAFLNETATATVRSSS